MSTDVQTPASEKQIAFLTRLLSEKQHTYDVDPTQVSKRNASLMIDALIQAPRRSTGEGGATAELTPGVYRVDGVVYIVKPNQAKTHLYAKALIEINGERLNLDDEHVSIEFEYAPGAIRRIKASDRMPLEEGKALTLRYGKCICCGRVLKAAKSVEAGIGPVCIRYFG